MGKCLCRQRFAVLAGLFIALSGCGPSKSVVEGRITLDGKPLPSGTISLEPTVSGGKAFDSDINDGKYCIEIPREDASGKYVIRIMSLQPTGRKLAAGPPAPPGTMIEEIADAIPEQYNAKSTLQVDLASSGPHDFTLSTPSK
jgi:hypothetical protein